MCLKKCCFCQLRQPHCSDPGNCQAVQQTPSSAERFSGPPELPLGVDGGDCWVSLERLKSTGPAQPGSYNVALRYSKLLLQGGSALSKTLIARARGSLLTTGAGCF